MPFKETICIVTKKLYLQFSYLSEVIVNTIRDRIALIGAKTEKINLDTMQTRLYEFEA